MPIVIYYNKREQTVPQHLIQYLFLLTSLLATASSGCTRFERWDSPDWLGFTDKPKVPSRMVAMWSDTILQQPRKPGVRGIGGRVMFYVSAQSEPVKVDGTLTVYAYDDSNDGPHNGPPDRKFVFLADQLPTHYSDSQIGHSYSFWLPWDEVGGEQRKLNLIARFEDESGKTVTSELSQQVLPGKLPAQEEQPLAANGVNQPVSYQAALDPRNRPAVGLQQGVNRQAAYVAGNRSLVPRRMTTTTFTVSPEFASRTAPLAAELAQAASQLGSAGRRMPATNAAAQFAGARQQTNWPNRRANPYVARQVPRVGQQRARFARSRFLAQSQQSSQQAPAHGQRPPRPAASQPGLPPTPRRGQWNQTPFSPPGSFVTEPSVTYR